MVELGQIASQSLTMMLHEMATNAVKYGALSTDQGKVAVDWRVEADGAARQIALIWAESGGPAVSAPERPGQGTRFIEGSARYELRGNAKFDYAPTGLRAVIDFPLRKTDNPPVSSTESEPRDR